MTTTTEATRTAMHIVVPIRGPDGQAVAGAAFTVRREFAVLGQRMLLLAVAVNLYVKKLATTRKA